MNVSVLIITYNQSAYIEQAIESVLMQKASDAYEFILLDDNSTDDTFEKAYGLLKGRPFCSLIKNDQNLGITRNYQKGFSLCTGKYVFVLEGDDYWTDSLKMDKQINFLDNHPFHSMCFHPFIVQKGVTGVVDQNLVDKYSTKSDTFGINEILLNEGLIANFSVCCYRNKWLKRLPEALFDKLSYDWIINIFMGHFGLLGRINEAMSVYRHSDSSAWSKNSLYGNISKALDLLPVYNELLEGKYAQLFEQKSVMLKRQLSEIEKGNPKGNSIVFSRMKKYIKLLIPPIFILRK